MNKFIKEQLKKVSVPLPDYNETDTQIVIDKVDKNFIQEFIVGNCYLISVEDYIIHPYPGFILHDNWNNGIVPKYKFMKVEIIQKMNQMIKVNSIAFDIEKQLDIPYTWSGWLPVQSCKLIRQLC